jgi:hypothetical protein
VIKIFPLNLEIIKELLYMTNIIEKNNLPCGCSIYEPYVTNSNKKFDDYWKAIISCKKHKKRYHRTLQRVFIEIDD